MCMAIHSQCIKYLTCSIYQMTVFTIKAHLRQFPASPLKIFCRDLKKSVHETLSPVVQVAKRQEEFQNVLGSLPKKELFSRVTSGRKDKGFLPAKYAVAFVKEVIDSATFACEVIKSKHLEDVYYSPMQSGLLNIYLFRRRKKKKLRLKILQKTNLIRKCICLPQKRGLTFPLLNEIGRL